MLLPVYSGQIYSYSYEVETGHYFLYRNDYKAHTYLQGDDARIFREQIDHIDNLPPPKCNDGRILKTSSVFICEKSRPTDPLDGSLPNHLNILSLP